MHLIEENLFKTDVQKSKSKLITPLWHDFGSYLIMLSKFKKKKKNNYNNNNNNNIASFHYDSKGNILKFYRI